MYIFKNAWKSITRNKGRNILIGIIVLVIAAASTIALAIMNTSKSLIDSYENKYAVTASIGVNRQNMMKNFDPSSSTSKDNLVDSFSKINSLTVDQIKSYGDSKYVSSYYYTISIGLDGSGISPATTTKTNDNAKAMPEGMDKGTEANKTDFKLVGYSSIEAMSEFINGKYTISSGKVSEEDNTCVINSELASLNNLKVGDTIKLTDDNNNIYKLTISGIFTENSSDNEMSMFSNSVNNIITTANTVSTITGKNSTLKSTITPTFTLTSKDVVSKFSDELTKKGLDENLSVNTNLDTISESTKTISNVKTFATTFLIIVLIIGGVVLLVLSAINIRERKYEIGVMRTIGMKKSTLALQFMIELMMVSLFALIIGAGIGSALSVPVSNKLLASEISSSKEEQTNIGKNFGMGPNSGNDNNSEKPDFSKMEGVSKVQAFTSINAAVDLKVLAEVLAIGLGLSIISSLASIAAIEKFSPLTILKERS
jgi:putative ABC transport system permease protein